MECQSRFTRRFDLDKHALTVHEGRRPFACEVCLAAFGQKHHMVRHVRAVHRGERLFGCEECGGRFARKEHLFNHRRAVHKLGGVGCLLCEVEVTDGKALVRHLEETHTVRKARAEKLAEWQPGSEAPVLEELLRL